MEPLDHKLRKNGFDYILVRREENVAIYRQECAEDVNYYEAFIVKTRPEKVFKGVLREAHEVFPANEDFGKTAWACHSLEDTNRRFEGLRQREKNLQ